MVTNLDIERQLVPHHRAPSTSSRASVSRRHRQSRSHHGSTSATPQNEFPFFAQTGDVEISLSAINGRKEQKYLLHSLILSQGSGFFDRSLDTNVVPADVSGPPETSIHQPRPLQPNHAIANGPPLDSRSISAVARRPPEQRSRKRWRFVLDWGNTADQDVPMLVQRQPTFAEDGVPPPISRGNKPPTSSAAFFRTMTNMSALNLGSQADVSSDGPDDEILRDYDNLLRVLYNHPPALDGVNIAYAYTECKALLHLAEMYDALDIVGVRVDHHLLRFGNRLFKQVAKYPSSYLKLGYLAKSKTIFAEALIHVVGQWPLARPQLERQVDLAVMDLIEDKVDILAEIKERVELKLFRLTLTTSRGERVTPSTSFLDWLALSCFRQWLADNTSPPPTIAPARKDSARDPQPSTSDRRTLRSAALTAAPTSRSLVPVSQTINASRPSSRRDSVQPSQTHSCQSGRVYRLLGSVNKEAYLNQDDLKRFLKHAPEGLYTRDNLRRFQRRMDEIKGLAKEIVRPLVRNTLELDLAAAGFGEGAGLGYLTCIKVGERDFPWED